MVLFALLACTAAPPAPPPPPPTPPRTHAVVLVIDTLRADVTDEVATPFLDVLAAKGTKATRAWSGGTWTVPSVITLFTGRSVREHGWDLPTGQMGRYPPLPAVETLAEFLHGQGFATAGLYANPYLSEAIGFDRGFDSWHRAGDRGMAKAVAKQVDTWSDGRRHFLYVHLLGPHSPLKPSPGAAAKWGVDPTWTDTRAGLSIGAAKRDEPGARDAYRAAYRAVVEDTDLVVSDIVHALDAWLDDTALIVTSDHGELLGEHDVIGHGTHVWEPLAHVPLVAVGTPPLPPVVSNAVVPDLVTRALGLEHDWPSRLDAPLPLVVQREGQVAVSVDGVEKAIWDGGPPRVYDVVADPLEASPLAKPDAASIAARAAFEARVPAGRLETGTVAMPGADVEALRALGYVDP